MSERKKISPPPALPDTEHMFPLHHPRFRTAYGPRLRVALEPEGESMTKQSFKDECDVNVIMRRYEQYGLPVLQPDQEPQYGDATGVEFDQAMRLVAEARSRFEGLSARARLHFNNDPGQFLTFMENPDPKVLKDLGMLTPEAVARMEAPPAADASPQKIPPPAPPGAAGAPAASP